VYLNGTLVSGASPESRLPIANRDFARLGSKTLNDDLCSASFEVQADSNGQILVFGSNVMLGGVTIDGTMALMQSGGALMGLRSSFGLAPAPAIGPYQFGGFANLSFLQPTAGREALSRESIEQIGGLVALAERAASELIAPTVAADKNNAFLQWLLSHGRFDLAQRLSIKIFPEGHDVELGQINRVRRGRTAHYYTGTDEQILGTFSNENLCLLQIAQANPRRKVQLHYVEHTLRVPQVPDSAQVTYAYKGAELTIREASVLIRITAILRDDYLIPDVEVLLADISHRVSILSEKAGERLKLYISRTSSLLPPLLECYDRAYDVFTQFMKDFVRVHVYPKIQQFVPSSTRDGVDALRKLLMRNRELYRYEEAERGDLEGVLGEYLSGSTTLTEVLRVTRSATRAQSQSVSREQVGTIEAVVPDVVESPITPATEGTDEFTASPPIVRDDIASEMKILTTTERHSQLNNFTMLLGLSDRLMRTEAEFFRTPHTTRILWGGHRVIYIFTEATGRLSLYYDIELREPIEQSKASGGMFPTTTLITKTRVFIPVPDELTDAFQVAAGPKEFFVRFDVLASDID
jgi:molecular chaperone HtpG